MDWLQQLNTLRARRFDTAEALREELKKPEIQALINGLAKYYFDESVSGCINCFEDMYYRLRLIKMERKYKIRNGALLRDVINYDSELVMTANNCEDLLAEYHLLSNPNSHVFFVIPTKDNLPKVLKALAKKYPNGASDVLAKLKSTEVPEPMPMPKTEPTVITEEAKALAITEATESISSGADREFIKENLVETGYTEELAEEIVTAAEKALKE